MGLFQKLCNQTRKPEGLLGKLMAGGMNIGHAKLAEWGMSSLRGCLGQYVFIHSGLDL